MSKDLNKFIQQSIAATEMFPKMLEADKAHIKELHKDHKYEVVEGINHFGIKCDCGAEIWMDW